MAKERNQNIVIGDDLTLRLIDANYAGTVRSCDCTLILCEGDSAKAGILSGLSSDDRNYFGVFPLKGKLRNVHDKDIGVISINTSYTIHNKNTIIFMGGEMRGARLHAPPDPSLAWPWVSAR